MTRTTDTLRMRGDTMTTKTIDLTRSVQSLCQEYPELIAILEELEFKEITKPGMLATVGRVMTIPKGAAMRGISMDEIRSTPRGPRFRSEGIRLSRRAVTGIATGIVTGTTTSAHD